MPLSVVLYAIMAALTLVAVLNLTRPWLKRGPRNDAVRRASNVTAYRQRLSEIDNEVDAGLIAAETAPLMRDEAGARLLEDVAGIPVEAAFAAEHRPSPRGALILLALLGTAAGGYYYSQGSWHVQQLVSGEVQPAAMTPEAMDAMVSSLAQRLQATPDDADGWAMLGRSEFVLQRYAESAKAYAQVNRITDDRNPDALTAEGEALALAGNRDLSGRPRELFEKALALNPDHGKSLWYGGLAAAQAGEAALARQRWNRLLAQPLPEDLRQILGQRLAELGPDASGVASDDRAAATPGPATPATPSPVSLQLRLSLAPELRQKVPQDAVLMVFARASGGPPMPLAVRRGPAPELPTDITLDDSMGVMPTMKLSQFDNWIVTARISRSGQAQAESGDLQGSRTVSRSQAGEPLTLTIDRLLP